MDIVEEKYLCFPHFFVSFTILSSYINIGFKKIPSLRVLLLSEYLNQSGLTCLAHFFNLAGCTCRTTVSFRTMNANNLKRSSLPLNICFRQRNLLPNGVNALPKLNIDLKAPNFVQFGPYDFFLQISPPCGANAFQIICEETLELQCQHQ